MNRRHLVKLAFKVSLAPGMALAALQARAQPVYPVSRQQLEGAIATRFPRTYPLGGLLNLTLQAPQLRLLPDLNRLGALMALQAAGPALHRSYAGSFDTEFALRYEPSDLTLRAHQLRVNALRLDGLPAGQSALLDAYGPALAERALQDAVLHTFRPQDLALPDGMGLQPGSITVTAEGLAIGFVNKPSS